MEWNANDEQDDIRRQVERRVKHLNEKAKKEVMEKRRKERALRSNTWPAPSSSGVRPAPPARNGDEATILPTTNGTDHASPQYRRSHTPRTLRHVRFMEGKDDTITNGVGGEQDNRVVKIRDV
jgi:hypothetical protein